MNQNGAISALAVAGMLLAGCGGSSSSDSTADAASPFVKQCEALAGLPVDGGSVTTATYTAASDGDPSSALWPDHCLVRGAMNERTGIDGKPYALRFEVRLPAEWNDRLYYQGGSGVDGTLFTAVGRYAGGGNTRNALIDGFAVVTTDSGHQTEAGVANGAFLFGADPQARDEYGDMQIPQVTAAARTVIERLYGSPDQYAYFVGCSNGGRQAMIAAQRYPDLFNGIIASAPGFRLAQASIQALYQAQLTAEVAPMGQGGAPDLSQGLTDQEKTVVRDRILDSCDAMDGLEDGMVNMVSACQLDPTEWACGQGESDNCLSPQKADYVAAMFAGAYTSDDQLIYAPWPFDPGMVAQFGNPFLGIFAGEASHIYTTPPTITEDLTGYALNADIDQEYQKLRATNGTFQRSGIDFTNGESPNLDAFRANGGKLIMLNGSADLAFSPLDMAAYYDEVEDRYGPATEDFLRAYVIPGMGHCSGGQATDQFDSFQALRQWAEQGNRPEAITATAGDGTPWPGRTRPLCPYPSAAIYDGVGNPESAQSFRCEDPL
ncbi:tannase/feruloyl esterase family alpha/beta hydrolase [Alloalcanivorax marinus]|uniref:tannase/feruloyl esterase family alpha/beta hydrolase n=1 Tax=Alloalcanivorax marinus TaxID=1177169 RepID=UPI00195ED676|nr:tannase/feruloyl esterase family alpha/beta hydrolase [Alloalcanivorax marinus]